MHVLEGLLLKGKMPVQRSMSMQESMLLKPQKQGLVLLALLQKQGLVLLAPVTME